MSKVTETTAPASDTTSGRYPWSVNSGSETSGVIGSSFVEQPHIVIAINDNNKNSFLYMVKILSM